MAHDFNNVLTVILGFSDLLRERLEQDDAGTFEVEQIETAAERARSLTSQLLSFSRKQMLKLEPVSLNELVVESSSLIERLIGEQIKVQLLLDPAAGHRPGGPRSAAAGPPQSRGQRPRFDG